VGREELCSQATKIAVAQHRQRSGYAPGLEGALATTQGQPSTGCDVEGEQVMGVAAAGRSHKMPVNAASVWPRPPYLEDGLQTLIVAKGRAADG
jgi:hypothetical protein